MKKLIIVALISLVFLGAANFAFASTSSADKQDNKSENPVEIYYFYGSTCPVCKKITSLLEEFEGEYSSLKINSYEVFGDRENAKFFIQLLESCGEEKTVRVPVVFIGEEIIRGYLNDETTGRIIEKAIKNCLEKGCPKSFG